MFRSDWHRADFRVVQWLRKNTLDRLSFTLFSHETETGGMWKERKEAETALKNYISEYPCMSLSDSWSTLTNYGIL